MAEAAVPPENIVCRVPMFLAAAIVAKHTDAVATLPLSIGLFGNWGSGKSHFMNLVDQEVRALSEQARAEANAPPIAEPMSP